jgi:hypothetical protein
MTQFNNITTSEASLEQCGGTRQTIDTCVLRRGYMAPLMAPLQHSEIQSGSDYIVAEASSGVLVKCGS